MSLLEWSTFVCKLLVIFDLILISYINSQTDTGYFNEHHPKQLQYMFIEHSMWTFRAQGGKVYKPLDFFFIQVINC